MAQPVVWLSRGAARLRHLDAFEGSVIVVAHDRAFLRSFTSRVLEVRDRRLTALEPGVPSR